MKWFWYLRRWGFTVQYITMTHNFMFHPLATFVSTSLWVETFHWTYSTSYAYYFEKLWHDVLVIIIKLKETRKPKLPPLFNTQLVVTGLTDIQQRGFTCVYNDPTRISIENIIIKIILINVNTRVYTYIQRVVTCFQVTLIKTGTCWQKRGSRGNYNPAASEIEKYLH